MINKNALRILFIITFVLVMGFTVFAGADYPDRPIKMIVPWPAAGITDLTARALQFPLQEELGVPVVVNNMPGGSALIGSEFVANAEPDGYTVLFSSDSPGHWRVLGISPDMSFDDFNPLMLVSIGFSTVCVRADSKWNTFEELIEDIKSRPGEISLSHAGLGTSAHTMSLILEKFAGLKLKTVPYTGGGPANVALLNGEVDLSFQLMSSVIEYVNSGDFRLLATFTEERTDYFPDVPAVGEALPEVQPYVRGSTFGTLCTPKGTPAEVNEKLTDALKVAVKDPKWQEVAKSKQLVTPYLTGEAAIQFINEWASFKSWLFYEGGIAEHSPEEFDIPKPY